MEQKQPDNVYRAMEELIAELRASSNSALADKLYHRIHSVSWTTQSELLEELKFILEEALHSPPTTSLGLRERMKDVLATLSGQIP
jgi:hypothetical protein